MILLIFLHLNLSAPAFVERSVEAIATQDSFLASQPLLVPYRAEIASAAARYHLPPSLIAAVIQEESRFALWATRHEPRYQQNRRVKRAAFGWVRSHAGGPNAATELDDRARSYGLMQVMGETAREQGFAAPYLAELYLPENAVEHGARVLAQLIARYHADTLAAISAYNQGTARKRRGVYLNARYVYRVCLAWRAYAVIFGKEGP
jgi:soluble lytic murein transglycosylase-like protein